MKFSVCPFLFIAASLLIACSREAVPSGVEVERQGVAAYVPDVLSVQFDEDTASQLEDSLRAGAVPAFLRQAGVSAAERSFPYDEEWEDRHREFGLHRWYRLSLDGVPLTKAAGDLSGIPGVESAELVRRARPAAYFNDPRASEQWALKNNGASMGMYKAGIDVNVEPVWSHFTAGRQDIIVAVIDEGVDMTHEDLQGVCIPAGADGSCNFIPSDNKYFIPAGTHGTHVAGVIAAVNDNGIGISGIAGGDGTSPGVKILSCVIFKPDPENPDESISGYTDQALVWAADHGAVIANNSWGYVYETEDEARRGATGAQMGAAIDYFIATAGCDRNGKQRADSPMKGGLVLFSAGNESWGFGWPAQDHRVVAVGAVASSGERAYYSNYGSWVDVSAPGGDLKLGPGILSTIPGNSYASYQGTSMACPNASGVAALILSRYGGPGFTSAMLRDRLLKGAKARTALDAAPLVDAMGSICYGGTTPPLKLEKPECYGTSNNIVLSFPVPADEDDDRAFGYRIFASRERSALERLSPALKPQGVICEDFFTGKVPLGGNYTATLSGLEFETGYFVTVYAFDYNRNYSPSCGILYAETGTNNPPVVQTDYPGPFSLKAHESLRTVYRYSDPDGHKTRISVEPGSDAFRYVADGGVLSIAIEGNRAPVGKYRAVVTVSDEFGAQTVCNIDYELLPNHAPVLIKPMEDILFDAKGQSVSLNLGDYFADEDGEDLRYSVTSSVKKVAGFTWGASSFTVSSEEFGFTEVNVTGTDARGETVSSDFKILVRDTSYPFDVYPNPVSTILYVRTVESGTIEYVLSNKAGATVLRGRSEAGLFAPMQIDVTAIASGTYNLSLKGCGLNNSVTVVKI